MDLTEFHNMFSRNPGIGRQLATKAVKRERQVEFFVMLKNDLNGKLSMVVECALKRNGKKRRNYWMRNEFITQSVEYKDCIIRDYQSFRIKLTGNIDSPIDQDYVVSFNPNKKKQYHIFHLTNDTTTTTIQGEVNIELQVVVRQNDKQHTATVPTVHVKSGFFGSLCHNSIDHIEAAQVAYGKMFKSELVLPVDKQTPDPSSNVKVDPDDPQYLDSQLTELLQQSTSDWKTDNASDRNNFNQPNKQQKLCIFKTPLKSSMG